MASSNDKVLSWIGGASTIQGQDTVKLSKVIENFETDFSNGWVSHWRNTAPIWNH